VYTIHFRICNILITFKYMFKKEEEEEEEEEEVIFPIFEEIVLGGE
jgi:hypothetical protein